MRSNPELTDLFDQIADEFSSRVRSGEEPSISEYVDRYPKLEAKIKRLFPVLRAMEAEAGMGQADEFEDSDFLEEELKKLENLPPQKQLGDYRIIREIGRGGMGIVYEAEQESLGRRVALKILPNLAHLDPRRLQRFQQEARASARLHHTNIVTVFGVGRDEQMSYMVMQLIDGSSLDKVIRELRSQSDPEFYKAETEKLDNTSAVKLASDLKSKDVSSSKVPASSEVADARQWKSTSQASDWAPDETGKETADEFAASAVSAGSFSDGFQFFRNVAQIGVQVGNALEYAHGSGLLHRDIKPANLMIDESCKVWVTDFGLAKSIGEDGLTRTGETVGTMRYLPPEQLEGKSDVRSDVYSLGLTLYELLCLRPAFPDQDYGQLIKNLSEREPVNPRKINARIPRDLNTIVLKAIAKSPNARYRTAADFVDDLNRFLEGKPIAAKQVSEFDRLVKAIRRWPVVSTLIFLLLTSMLVGTALVSWQWRKTTVALNVAQEERRKTSVALDAAQEETKARNEVLEFFMTDVFGQSLPDADNEQDLKLSTALERAATELDDRFEEKPMINAEIRSVIGRSLVSLGRVKAGQANVETALRLREEHLPTDDPKIWESRHDMVMLASKLSNHDEALKKVDEILVAAKERDIGRDIPSLMVDKATILTNLAKYTEAEKLLLETRDIALADDRPRIVYECDQRIAELAYNLGEFEKAEKLCRTLVDYVTELHETEEHYESIAANNLLGLAIDGQRNHEESEVVFRKFYDISMRKLGPYHFETLAIGNNLIISLMHQGKLEDAEKILVKHIEALDEHLGPFHEDSLGAQNNLATLYMMRRDYANAIQIFEKIRPLTLERFGPFHPDSVTNTNNLAVLYRKTKEFEKSEEMFRLAIDSGKETWGERHPHVINTIAGLAAVKAKQQEYETARELYEQALELSLDVMGDGNRDTIQTRSEYARLLRDMDEFELARQQFEKLLKTYEANGDGETEPALMARLHMATVLKGLEKPQESIRELDQLLELRRKVHGETEAGVIQILFLLTNQQHAIGEHQQVKTRLNQFLADHADSTDWWYFKAKSRLGRALSNLGELEEAQKLLIEAYQEFDSRSLWPELSEEKRKSELRSAASRLIKLFEKRDDADAVENWKAEYRRHKKRKD